MLKSMFLAANWIVTVLFTHIFALARPTRASNGIYILTM